MKYYPLGKEPEWVDRTFTLKRPWNIGPTGEIRSRVEKPVLIWAEERCLDSK